MLISRTWRNYQRIITSAVLERNVQKKLISDNAQKRFLYHRKLIQLISENYHDIDSGFVESVAIAHFLHFQYLYFTINYQYLPFTLDAGHEAKQALQVLEDKSRDIIYRLIPDQFDGHRLLHNSFRYLNEHISRYHQACLSKELIDQNTYEELVTPMAAVLHIPVQIFSLVTADDRYNEYLKRGLNDYFLGKKIIMDIMDFKYDASVNVWNYVQSTFESTMRGQGIITDTFDSSRKARYFYVSGVANEMYDRAMGHFKKNIASWEELPSGAMILFPKQEIVQILRIKRTLTRLINKAERQSEVTTA